MSAIEKSKLMDRVWLLVWVLGMVLAILGLMSGCTSIAAQDLIPDEVTGYLFRTRGDGTSSGNAPYTRFSDTQTNSEAYTIGVSATYYTWKFKQHRPLADRIGRKPEPETGHQHRE